MVDAEYQHFENLNNEHIREANATLKEIKAIHDSITQTVGNTRCNMERNYQQDFDMATISITNTIKALENKIKRLDERIGDLDIQFCGL